MTTSPRPGAEFASKPGDSRFVRSYVQHHLVGSRAGLDLFERASSSHSDGETRAALTRLAREVAEDREALQRIADDLGASHVQPAQLAASIGERLARLKPNGRLVRRSPLSDVAELEAMILGVTGKRQCWVALALLADADPRLDRQNLERLRERADAQITELTRLHARASVALPRD